MSNTTQPQSDTVTQLVLSTLNDVLADREAPDALLNEETSLIGSGSVLDSMGLVTLIVDLEQKLDEEYGLCLTLADDRAMSLRNSPFRTVRALTEYICALVEEQR